MKTSPANGTTSHRVRALSMLGIGATLITGTLLAASPSSATTHPACGFGIQATGDVALTGCGGPQPVQNPPVVDLQPVSQTVPEGASVTFTASVQPVTNTTQQWLYSSDDGTTWNPLTGDTASSLTITAALSESGDEFEAVFVNPAATVYTTPATLTVTPAVATTTTLASATNPQTTYNSVTYTATVASAPDGGTVEFFDGSTPIVGCEAVSLTSQLATCDADYFTPGVHTITAAYQGGAGYLASTSDPLTQTIDQLPAFNNVITPLLGVGEPFSYAFSAVGTPTPTVSLASGSIPPGLTLASNGTMSGTPTTAGSYAFTLQAVSSIGAQDFPISLKVRAKPALTIANSSLAEGNSGTHPMTFTVKLSRASTVAVTVHWKTVNGTAVSGSDYKAATGTLTIPAGKTSATLSVLVIGDKVHEANETFKVTLSSPTGASISVATAIGTIVNDD